MSYGCRQIKCNHCIGQVWSIQIVTQDIDVSLFRISITRHERSIRNAKFSWYYIYPAGTCNNLRNSSLTISYVTKAVIFISIMYFPFPHLFQWEPYPSHGHAIQSPPKIILYYSYFQHADCSLTDKWLHFQSNYNCDCVDELGSGFININNAILYLNWCDENDGFSTKTLANQCVCSSAFMDFCLVFIFEIPNKTSVSNTLYVNLSEHQTSSHVYLLILALRRPEIAS